jgi:hypothetical protein
MFTVTANGGSLSSSIFPTIIIQGQPQNPLTVTGPASLNSGVTGSAYSPVTFTASGGSNAGYTWSTANNLYGLTLSTGGVLSGTPSTPTQQGGAQVIVTVTDSQGHTASSQALTLSITGPLTITTTGPLSGTVAVPFNATLNAAGGTGNYTWSVLSGSLPANLGLVSNGTITGTPQAATTGVAVTFQVSDGQTTLNRSITVVINPAGSGNTVSKEYIRIGGRVIAIENH